MCSLGSYENVKLKTDPARQLITIFLSNAVSFKLPDACRILAQTDTKWKPT